MKNIQLYDSREARLKTVKSLRGDNIIRMYICGPTVYDYSHIGHFKTFIVYDTMVRFLKYSGFDVMHVVNITDIDDKIIRRANEEGRSYREVSEEFTEDFIANWRALNLLPPYALPRATYHIGDMHRIIQTLIEKGYAYVADGNVYFSVRRFEKYGEISKQSIDDLIAGYRVEEGEGKRDPLDFALWKRAKPGEPSWDSPWGRGRPGWHIECTAMSSKLLDPPFEIHGGGEDLKFPHHENERAQTNSYIGDESVYIWTHVGILKMAKEKMSKSLGNIVTMRELLRTMHPDTIRIFTISTHYRKQSEYSDEKIREAQNIQRRIQSVYNRLIRTESGGGTIDVDQYREEIMKHLSNDLNTPAALSTFMSFLDELSSSLSAGGLNKEARENALRLYKEIQYIFGLQLETKLETRGILELLINVRKELRKRKIYDVADMIREELGKKGVVLEDIGEDTIYYTV